MGPTLFHAHTQQQKPTKTELFVSLLLTYLLPHSLRTEPKGRQRQARKISTILSQLHLVTILPVWLEEKGNARKE